MEFQVRHVGGIENCFVSLPLSLIQTLESTRPGGFITQVLTLQLRSPATNQQWVVAWSGDTSSSSAIEVAGQFGDCISLPDHANVQVKAVPNVTSATLVTIEPSSEDDWEVLELNAELAEAAMLQQVRIVHETMRFPLWLHGHTIITFLVVSTSPKKAVVQLVPGTEVSVAPKRRKTDVKKQLVQSSSKKLNIAKALLRLQDSDRRLIHKSEVKGIELGVALTSVAYIHPETAKQFLLDSLQLVTIVPRLSSKETTRASDSNILRSRSSTNLKEPNKDVTGDKKRSCQAAVRILLSESVAKGHIMIARSLRLYLRASLHSWVYLKIFTADAREDITPLSLSPCYFKMLGEDNAIEKNGLEVLDRHRIQKPGSESTGTYMGTVDWSIPEKFAARLSNNFPSEEDQDTGIQSGIEKGLRGLLQAWFLAQLNAIASASGSEITSLIFGKETILHFEVKGIDIETDRNVEIPGSSNSYGLLQNRKSTVGVSLECFFLLNINEESVQDSNFNSYKLAFDARGKENLIELELFRKLKFGDPVSLHAYKEKSSSKIFTGNLSSLSWMETTAADIIGRIMVLLSPASGMLFSTYNFPTPGHVLICGPHGSGKTILAKAVAKSLEESEDLLAHVVFVGCSGLALEKASTMRQAVSSYISEALDHAPSLVIFDDLDSIISSSSDSEGSQPSTSVVALTKFLTDIMDEYGENRRSSCGIGPIAFVACVQALENISKSLSSSGRFDFHVQLPVPAASERQAILRHEIKR